MSAIQEQLQPESSNDSPTDYQVLRPDSYHTQLHSQEALLEKYIALLGPLVEKAVGDEQTPGFDTLVFMDKSARPLAWMMRKFWPHIAPQQRDPATGELQTAPMPEMKFVNIDRLPWRKNPKVEIDEAGMKNITDADVEGLRDIFQPRLHEDGTKTKHNLLDNKRILLIDEQAESGDTLKVAKKLFSQAFPTSEIEIKAWIYHPYKTDSKQGSRLSDVKEIPMWYPSKDPATQLHKDTGRGVLSPVPYSSYNPAHAERFKPSSYQFLSTRPEFARSTTEFTPEEEERLSEISHALEFADDPREIAELSQEQHNIMFIRDPESLQLRREIGQMALDFTSGKLAPAIMTKREEILGEPALAYNLRARSIREARPKS